MPGSPAPRWRRARWMFFGLLGATSLVKGIGFGAVIVLSIVAAMLLWQRDRITLRRLCFPAGWLLAVALALTWPLLMIARHGSGALALWAMHVTDRLNGPNGPVRSPASHGGNTCRRSWPRPSPGPRWPWPGPTARCGRAFSRLASAVGPPVDQVRHQLPAIVVAGDRLLWAWTVVPLALLALATVKNAHYAIAAQVPWSIWAALALARLGEGCVAAAGIDRRCARRWRGFAASPCSTDGPLAARASFDRRGVEWAFYESVGRDAPRHDVRSPFSTMTGTASRMSAPSARFPTIWPFGSSTWVVPPAGTRAPNRCWRATTPTDAGLAFRSCLPIRPASLTEFPPAFVVVGRVRDLPELEKVGRVEVIAHGPTIRQDRT